MKYIRMFIIRMSMRLTEIIENASRIIEELRSAVSRELKEKYEKMGIRGIVELLEEEIDELDVVMTAGAELQFEPTVGDLKQAEDLCSERGGMRRDIDPSRGIRFFAIPIFEGGTMEQRDHMGFACIIINIARGRGFLWLTKLKSERSALQEATFLLSKVM